MLTSVCEIYNTIENIEKIQFRILELFSVDFEEYLYNIIYSPFSYFHKLIILSSITKSRVGPQDHTIRPYYYDHICTKYCARDNNINFSVGEMKNTKTRRASDLAGVVVHDSAVHPPAEGSRVEKRGWRVRSRSSFFSPALLYYKPLIYCIYSGRPVMPANE